MYWIDTITIRVIATIILLPGYVLSSCCYSISTQPLQPSSTNKPDNNAPPSYAISLSATSQFAVNNPGGPVYLALITFPGTYVISAIPNGCVSVSINSVNCTSSGMNALVADFARVIVADGTQPKLETVVVNGEVCAVGSSCPSYTPTNPGPTATPTPSTSSKPSSSSHSSSTSSPSSQPPHMSSSPSPPTPISDPGDIPTSNAMGSHRSKIGLIVGLTLAFALLIFLACLYFLRRRHQNPQTKFSTSGSHVSGRWDGIAAAAAHFRIKRKGSKLSIGRTSLHGSPYMVPTSEKVVSSNEDPFLRANAALARSTSTISTTTVSEKSMMAMGTGTGLGMTLIDIPEAHEPEDSSSSSSFSSEVNYFQNENDQLERDLDAEFAEATITTTTELVNKDNNNDNQQASSSTSRHPWIARAASKSARLHRAVSTASSRLLPLHSTDVSRRSLIEQQEQPLTRTHSGRPINPGPRFPKDGLFFKENSRPERPSTPSAYSFMSIPRPPKSVHRLSSRDTSNYGQVVATIRPEHHQELIHQQRLDQGLTPDQPLPSYTFRQLASGATSAGTAANAAALSAAVAQMGNPGLFRSMSDSPGSAVDSFINPGPPPQPPTRVMSRSRQASTSGNESGSRRGYNQPIHIRPPGPTFQPDQQQAQAGSEGGSGLYGYM